MAIEYAGCQQELAEIDEAIEEVIDYHRDMAKSCWPNGTILACPRCKRVQTASVGQVAHYLAHGWPECHGQPMHIGDLPEN